MNNTDIKQRITQTLDMLNDDQLSLPEYRQLQYFKSLVEKAGLRLLEEEQ